jgi:hypothetical protein
VTGEDRKARWDGRTLKRVRALAPVTKEGDRQAMKQALDVLVKRFGHNPWLSDKIEKIK